MRKSIVMLVALLLMLSYAQNLTNASISVSFSPGSIVLKDGASSTDIFISVKGNDGNPVKKAKVFVRLVDPKNTGILGANGFADAVVFADDSGQVKQTLEFPSASEISRLRREDFPLDLQVIVFTSKHDWTEEWAINKTATLRIDLPYPEITSISADPAGVQQNSSTKLTVSIHDPDSADFTYGFHTPYGTWDADSINAISPSTKSAAVLWRAPIRGMNPNEIAIARNFAEQLPYVTLAMAASGSDTLRSRYKTSLSTYPLGLIPYSNSAKQDSSVNFAGMMAGAPSSASLQDAKKYAFNRIGLGMDYAKITVGFIHLRADAGPIINPLLNNDAGMGDAFAGSLAARVADLAAKDAARSTRTGSLTCVAEMNVSDEADTDGAAYPFEMAYTGFNNG